MASKSLMELNWTLWLQQCLRPVILSIYTLALIDTTQVCLAFVPFGGCEKFSVENKTQLKGGRATNANVAMLMSLCIFWVSANRLATSTSTSCFDALPLVGMKLTDILGICFILNAKQ